ncbi:MAG: TonB-dependent receptor [Bacteroidetes bacterium]|nr:TonB-dependent receptor [Bacteroidota bacterium]
MKKTLFALILSTSFLQLKSQNDTTLQKTFDEIIINASRQQAFATGTRKDFADSIFKNSYKFLSLSSVLNFSGSLLIRNYGPGNISTSSLRGGNSYQTSVSWDGFSLNNNINGLCDFNLIPSFLFDEISINPGIPSGIQGSGSIGGGINISNSKSNENITEFLQTYGSFSSINTGLKNNFNKRNFTNSLKAFYSFSKNDYSFKNITEQNNPEYKLKNAKTLMFTLIDELYFDVKKIGKFKIAYWTTHSERQIPPTMIMQESKAFQNDKSNKISLKWSKKINNLSLNLSSINQKDYLKYNDIEQNINSITNNNTYIGDFELRYYLHNQSVSGFGVTATKSIALVENVSLIDHFLYNNSVRNQISFWGSQILKLKPFRTEISLIFRKDFYEKKWLPIVPSAGFRSKINNNFVLYGQWGKVYRVPTMNDLYWEPGGNPFLNPESGYQFEQSISFNKKNKNFEVSSSATYFSRVINNWIQWQPVSSQIWSPFNLGKVHSRGFELRNSIKIKISKKAYCQLGINSNFIKSENIYKNDKNFGKQLIYVPFYNHSSFITFVISKTSIIVHTFTVSKRFTSNDNTEKINAYTIFNTSLKHTLNHKNTTTDLFLRINNILNTNYSEIAWRPMPNRNFESGINIRFKKNKK